jgi:hypothetical protein
VPLRRRERGFFNAKGSTYHRPREGDCTLKTTNIELPKVVTRAEWLDARQQLAQSILNIPAE